MAQRLKQIFLLCFSMAAAAVLLGTVLSWQGNGIAAFGLAAAVTLSAYPLVQRAAPAADRLSPARFRLAFWGLALLLLCGLSFAGWVWQEIPIMDWEVVHKSLPDLLEDFHFDGYNGYYLVCNNNLGHALLLGLAYLPAKMLGLELSVGWGVQFNAFMLWLGVLFACRCADLISQRKSAPLLVLLLSALYLPLYLMVPTFYSDTLCVPFLTGALCCFLHWERSRHPGWMIAAGAAGFFGFAVKGSLGILPIAFVLAALLCLKWDKKTLLGIGAMLLTFALLLGGYRLWQRQWLDWAEEDTLCCPTELWFCFGSHDDGDYSQQDVDDSYQLENMGQRREMLRSRIAENYSGRGLGGNLLFFYRKAVRTWGDGKYEAELYLCNQAQGNWLDHLIVPGLFGYMPMVYYCQVFHYLILLLLAVGAFVSAFRRKTPLLAAQLSIAGVVLFLSFWETKPRYTFHFAPLLLLCAALALLEPLRKNAASQCGKHK